MTAVPALAGAVLGLASAVLLGALMYRGSYRLNLRTFFNVTSLLLLLVGAGLRREQGQRTKSRQQATRDLSHGVSSFGVNASPKHWFGGTRGQATGEALAARPAARSPARSGCQPLPARSA